MASKRFKALVVTGLAVAVLAGIPATSSAKNYTGKTPAVAIDMMPVAPLTTTTVSPVVKKHAKLTSATKKVTKLSTSKKKAKKHRKSKKVKKA